MYCKFCGEVIDDDCIVCPKCGKQVGQLKGADTQQPIIINNSSSSSSSATAAAAVSTGRVRRQYNGLVDLCLIFFTGGLWIIWMIIRPKYY